MGVLKARKISSYAVSNPISSHEKTVYKVDFDLNPTKKHCIL
jgi:hypothetical protein